MAQLLIISPTPFAPRNAGNRARIDNLITSLEQAGHTIVFAHVQRELGDEPQMRARLGSRFYALAYTKPPVVHGRLNRVKRRFGMDSGYTMNIDAWYDKSVEKMIKHILCTHDIDTVWVEYAYMSKVLEAIPDSILKIIDTHDVFANRHRRYLEEGVRPSWLSCSPDDEIRALDRADVVCAIQEEEARHFRSQVAGRVVTLGHLVEVVKRVVDPGSANSMVYVGSRNPINVASLQWFLDKVFPSLRTRLDIDLLVVGSVCDSFGEGSGVQLLGPVEDLGAVYDQATLAINPARLGTGLKIKSIEALGHGLPLVATEIGAEGLGSTAGIRLAETSADFAQAIVEIVENQQLASQMSASAYQFVEEYNRDIVGSIDLVLNR